MKSVFISSTFKDMQAERDYLHERIFPRLRGVIGAYGEDICELDLRWGVDTSQMTEEESSHQVLRVCIDAIDRCRPYILVLLGERYGWIPDHSLVHSLRDERIENWYEDQMSITNLEILYGALSEADTLKQCVFCFRDPGVIEQIAEEKRPLYASESSLHRKKLDELKALIRSKEGAAILDYTASWDSQSGCITGLEDFGNAVYETLSAMIRRDFGAQTPKSFPEQMHLDVMRTKERFLSAYVPRYAEEGRILECLSAHCRLHGGSFPWTRGILLKGEAGSGKSALMASLAAAAEQSGQKVICYFSGNAGCQSSETLENYVAFRLEALFGLEHQDLPAKERILQAYEQVKDTPVLIFIDGLDQLFRGESQGFPDLLQLCPDFYYVLSSLSGFDTTRLTEEYIWGFETISLSGLNAEQREQFISLSAQKRGKKLDAIVTEMVVREPGAGNPLYLSLLLQRFFMMDRREFEAAEALAPGMEGLHLYMRGLLNEMPDDPVPMIQYLLSVVGQRFGLDACREILLLLAVSRAGLTERELEEILALAGIPFLPLPFQQMVSYLYDSFTQDSAGRWSFSHRLVLEAVSAGATEEEKRRAVSLLQQYALLNEEFLRSEGYYHLLAEQHPKGYLVFEQCSAWPNVETVHREICGLLDLSDTFADYYLKMAKDHPSESLALFWRHLHAEYYGTKADQCQYALLKAWQNGQGLSSDSYRELLMALGSLSLYYNEPSVLEYCRKKLLELTEDLPSGQRSIWRARLATLYARRYEIDPQISFEEIWQSLAEAQNLLQPLPADEDGNIRTEAAYETADLALELFYAQSHYGKSCDPDKLRQACSLISGYPDQIGDLDFEKLRITLLAELSYSYGKKPNFDSDKRIEAAKESVALAKKRADRSPSILNFKILQRSFGMLSNCYKKGFHLEYKEEMLRLSRRIYSLAPSDYGRYQLAYALCTYAEEACVSAERSATREEAIALKDKAERIWKEGFQLFERSSQAPSPYGKPDYAYCLTVCAEAEYGYGYYTKAQTHARKALDLLAEWRGQDPFHLLPAYTRDLFNLLALIALEHCRSEQAEEYASSAFQTAKAREAAIGKEFSDTEKAAWLLLESLYQQRKDREVLSLCEELSVFVENRTSNENSRRQRLRAGIFYLRARLAFEKEEFDDAKAYLEKLRPLCDRENNEDWYYGRLLILEAELTERDAEVSKETVSKSWWDAFLFWKSFKTMEEYWHQNNLIYLTSRKKKGVEKHASRKESGRYALCDFYHSYALCRRMSWLQDWSLVYKLDHTDDCIDQWDILPQIRPAYARIRALVPEEILATHTLKQDFLTPAQLQEETDSIAGQLLQKSSSPDECMQLFYTFFYEKLLKAYLAVISLQQSWEDLTKRYNRPEIAGQRNPLIGPGLTALFCSKAEQSVQIRKPLLALLPLCLLFWYRKEQLCDTACEQLVTILYDILCYSTDDILYNPANNIYRFHTEDLGDRFSLQKLNSGELRMLYGSISIRSEIKRESALDVSIQRARKMGQISEESNIWYIMKNSCALELAVRHGDRDILRERFSELPSILQQAKVLSSSTVNATAAFITQLILRGYELYSEDILEFLRTTPSYIEKCGTITCLQLRKSLAGNDNLDLNGDKKTGILQLLQFLDREGYLSNRKKLLCLGETDKKHVK